MCARVHERYCKEGLNLEGKDIRVSLMQPISREVDTTDPLEPDLVSLEVKLIIEIENDEQGVIGDFTTISRGDSNALIVVKSHITPSSELSISVLT